MAEVLISIKPVLVEQILSGSKNVEIRRRPLRVAPGTRVWIYSTGPTFRVDAVARVGTVEVGQSEDIWERISSESGVSQQKYQEYVAGSREVCAVWLTDIERLARSVTLQDLRSVVPGFHPPQFFQWVLEDSSLHNLLVNSLRGNSPQARS